MEWTSSKVRRAFLAYFESKEHTIVPSDSIVIKNDPTLMFTNAGMNQFKGIFVGNEDAFAPRVADTQKCLRVSGKHNDLEEVGRDHYHHTMFEMLGNWSFGDYFKKEAIYFAWDLLTNVYKLDKDRMYVTVFEGDDELGLKADKEAEQLWLEHISPDRIIKCGRKDNFWEMGETGPCGPCSEIHVDLRTEAERNVQSGKDLVNNDHPEVIEIWNLVFMQYNRLESGALQPLKEKHIDTGMGLERLVRVLQGVQSNYDTDIFKGLIETTQEATGLKYEGGDTLKDVAFRVIADHVRAVSFCIADGQLPSSTGAGYVIRRVLRRAIRYGYSQLKMDNPFIYKTAERLVTEMGSDFPELKKNEKIVVKVIREEEQSFLSTLSKGLEKLETLFVSQAKGQIKGEVAFELYDTYGFPIDLTQLIADEQGWTVDMVGFNSELVKQKDRSRNATKTSFGDWTVLDDGQNSLFVGYDEHTCETSIVKMRSATVKGKVSVQVVLKKTPFYAESGGQVGDIGKLVVGGETIRVMDTKKENGEIIHFVEKLPKDVEGNVLAQIDLAARVEAMKNHSATHLLHHSLRSVLGSHVEQKGSLVAPDRLRFDFSHYEKLSEVELQKIEQDVLRQINEGIKLEEWRNMPLEDAKEMGAMALFGEKYGNEVRVIKFGQSVELCGGTHVVSTNDIGGFKIVAEAGVASGVRRIEALAGAAYFNYVNAQLNTLEQVKDVLGNPKNPLESILKLQNELKELGKLLEMYKEGAKQALRANLLSKVRTIDGVKILIENVSGIDGKGAKDLAYNMSQENASSIVVLGGVDDDKPYLIVAAAKSLVESSGFDAGKTIRALAPYIDGGGGGQKFLAMAGGKNKQGLKEALVRADEIIRIQNHAS